MNHLQTNHQFDDHAPMGRVSSFMKTALQQVAAPYAPMNPMLFANSRLVELRRHFQTLATAQLVTVLSLLSVFYHQRVDDCGFFTVARLLSRGDLKRVSHSSISKLRKLSKILKIKLALFARAVDKK